MEKHIMRLSYGLCLLCAALALITRGLSALNISAVMFAGSGLSAVSYHAFMDGVILFFMTSVTTAAYVWVKKQYD
jgi:phosphate starvation-inducible membrane PsiE